MKNRYIDLIEQTFDFPQDGFSLKNGYLHFHDISIKSLIDIYGTPLRIVYLPKISEQIQKAKSLFFDAFQKNDYHAKYYYCYCTKSNHFSYVLNEVLKNNTHLETSSSFDIDLLEKLYEKSKISKETIIINNGFKTYEYIRKICTLINNGFSNVIPVCDNQQELQFYNRYVNAKKCNIGIRVATSEEPNFEFYTSRLGIANRAVLPFYKTQIAPNKKFCLKMLHFFIDTGIKDSIYYWNELKKAIKLYCDLKKVCPTLTAFNLGGGLPIRNGLGFEYDYAYMIDKIVAQIKDACEQEGIEHPDIFTEFGQFTVGESGATIFSVIGQKQQNDAELWYMVDNSLMNTLPDTWGIDARFMLLPINYWKNDYKRINIGGLSCDNSDYYNAETHINQVFLPKFNSDKEPLYIGFFHTGAYQDSIGGYGGIKHCLIPAPQQLILTKNEEGQIVRFLHLEEQKVEDMLRILGY